MSFSMPKNRTWTRTITNLTDVARAGGISVFFGFVREARIERRKAVLSTNRAADASCRRSHAPLVPGDIHQYPLERQEYRLASQAAAAAADPRCHELRCSHENFGGFAARWLQKR
jgi:hypothetical protein